MALDIEFCKDVPRCEQLESLLFNILWAIDLRDLYRAKSTIADSMDHLDRLVIKEMKKRYQDVAIVDEKYLKENAGNYTYRTGEIMVPNLCEGCATRPLCMWNMEGLRIHEKTHEVDARANPEIKKLFTDTRYRMENYTANELERVEAQMQGDLDYHAYDENARYLMDILQLELSQSTGCNFPPKFYLDLDKALKALE